MFVTHYPTLGTLEEKYPTAVGNFHMGYLEDKSQGDHHAITFLYKIVKGISSRSYGLNVARLAEVPAEVIAVAATKAAELEHAVMERRKRALEAQAQSADSPNAEAALSEDERKRLDALIGRIRAALHAKVGDGDGQAKYDVAELARLQKEAKPLLDRLNTHKSDRDGQSSSASASASPGVASAGSQSHSLSLSLSSSMDTD